MSDLQLGRSSRRSMLAGAAVVCLLCGSLALIFFVAPTEATMGNVQRILYLHVSAAWCGLAGCIAMACCGGMYLWRRQLSWDFWSQSSGEVGWLCTTLTLMSGSAWAHEAWGTWWTWEPRLTSSLLLWILYAGIFLVRSLIADPHRRGRVSAVLAIVAVSDVPLIFMATRWFRGIHPVSPEMEPMMRVVLVVAVVSFSIFFAYLVVCRRRQLELADFAAELDAFQWRRVFSGSIRSRSALRADAQESDVETLISTYAVAAIVVGSYVVWVTIGTKRLSRRLKQLKSSLEDVRPESDGKKSLENVA